MATKFGLQRSTRYKNLISPEASSLFILSSRKNKITTTHSVSIYTLRAPLSIITICKKWRFIDTHGTFQGLFPCWILAGLAFQVTTDLMNLRNHGITEGRGAMTFFPSSVELIARWREKTKWYLGMRTTKTNKDTEISNRKNKKLETWLNHWLNLNPKII